MKKKVKILISVLLITIVGIGIYMFGKREIIQADNKYREDIKMKIEKSDTKLYEDIKAENKNTNKNTINNNNTVQNNENEANENENTINNNTVQNNENENTINNNTVQNNENEVNKNEFWMKPTGAYPDLRLILNLNILVDTNKQKLFIRDSEKEITSFVISTGIFNGEADTPKGDFKIQEERGASFYSPYFKEGARYWVSFLNHGEYLFHSIPTDEYGNYIKEEGLKLGKPSSHGCVRMSVADAKWFYENIKMGTPIKIK